MLLDATTRESYRERGAALVKGAFTATELARLARGVERNRARPSREAYTRYGEEERGAFVYDYGCHASIPEYKEFARASGLAEMAAELLGSRRVCFFDDSYTVKQPGCEHPAPWHHDATYYEIDGPIVVAWVPLDPHGPHETLRLVAGSHRFGKRYLPVNFDPTGDPGPTAAAVHAYDPVPDIDTGAYEILEWEVAPGDVIFFDGLTLHGSRGNPTAGEQRRFNCRFVDANAVYAPHPDYPWGDGKANARLRPGQRLCEDPDAFPVLWEAPAQADPSSSIAR